MCGRFTVEIPSAILAEMFVLAEYPTILPCYNIFPAQQIPIIRQHSDGQNRLDYLHWGLIPAWAKCRSIGSKMFNARSETVWEKPAFRQAVLYRRCLVLASGYYEWSLVGKGKQPLYVHLKGNSPMVLAGLWESWKSPDGEAVDSCSILTTASNGLTESHRPLLSLMEPLQHRMPVILHPDDYGAWLDRKLADPANLVHLFHPYPADLMEMWPVSPLLNNPKNNSARLVDPV